MLVCERGTTVPRIGSTTVQGVLQRREALNQSRPCSDGVRSAGSTIQGQVCRQLGTTPIGEGSELVAGVDVILTNVSEAGVEGVHDGGRQATGQGGFGQDGTAGGNALQGVFSTRMLRQLSGFQTGNNAAMLAETEMEKAGDYGVDASTNVTFHPHPLSNHTHTLLSCYYYRYDYYYYYYYCCYYYC